MLDNKLSGMVNDCVYCFMDPSIWRLNVEALTDGCVEKPGLGQDMPVYFSIMLNVIEGCFYGRDKGWMVSGLRLLVQFAIEGCKAYELWCVCVWLGVYDFGDVRSDIIVEVIASMVSDSS